MDKLKIILVITALCFAALLVTSAINENGLTSDCVENCMEDYSPTSETVESVKPSKLQEKASQATPSGSEEITTQHIDVNKLDSTLAVEDEWCVAEQELSQSDLVYANLEYQEWQVQIGKASIKAGEAIYLDNTNYPNNEYVAPYQEMALHELQELANEGDTWAMVTLVQSWKADDVLKRDIARKLIVQGNTHYAIEYLVTSELAAAKSSYRSSGDLNASKEHIINAVSYVIFGLDNFSDGGLIAYAGNISMDELFKGPLNPSFILASSKDEIQSSYSKLVESIEKERIDRQVYVASPPKSVMSFFQKDLAVIRSSLGSGNTIDFLAELDVATNVTLEKTPCVEKHLALLTEKTRQ